VLLVHQLVSPNPEQITRWECLTKPGLKAGQEVSFAKADSDLVHLTAHCSPESDFSSYTRIVDFDCPESAFHEKLLELGHTPLPPYITQAPKNEQTLREIYQTTYAKLSGSVAAPTAGMHFTPELDDRLKEKGVQIIEVTLHVCLGTFLPVQDDQLTLKRLHKEYFELSEDAATVINTAKENGQPIVAVGTTTTRVLESRARDGKLLAGSGTTDLFIQPGDKYQIVDQLITNFHLPQSSLLMLLSAFVCAPNTTHRFTTFGATTAGKAYTAAIAHDYRFFSFGDAMYIL
jgi:S-adenosylmethionine:tRNA ribosyltransferase-isomerase